jgi:hypothetical protein
MNIIFPIPVIPITVIIVLFGLSDINFGIRIIVFKKILFILVPYYLEKVREYRTEN